MVSNVINNEEAFEFLDMELIAKQYHTAKSDGRDVSTSTLPSVDVIEFCESPQWGNLKLLPAQSLLLKIVYKLWDKYGFTLEEETLIQTELQTWSIDLLCRCNELPINHIMLIVGRRGLKSSTIAMILAYEVYRLILKGDPQKYYKLLPGVDIGVTNCASTEAQAHIVFNLAKDRVKSIPFFKPYFDNSTDNESELTFFTPKEVELNEAIRARNEQVPRGQAYKKEKLYKGSIHLVSIPTNASGSRGAGSVVIIFDEFAHFERPKRKKGSTDPRDLIGSNNRTDEAMYRALSPSAATFGTDYKIFVITSPLDKGGKCYQLYEEWKNYTDHLVFQFSTWEVNPTVPRDHPEVVSTERSDPIGFRCEWKGEFVESISKIVTETALAMMVDMDRSYNMFAEHNYAYIITLDPAKASDPDSDTYTVAWGHNEALEDGTLIQIIDGMQGFEAEVISDPATGDFIVAPVDPLYVDEFILNLKNNLKRVVGLFYDQFNSTSSIAKFRRAHIPAMETTYTNQYKQKMYMNYLQRVNSGLVKMYGKFGLSGEGSIEQERFFSEIRAIQRTIRGNLITYHHPETGPITTDDYVDAVANLVHQLTKYGEMGQTFMQEVMKASKGVPVNFGQGQKPILTSGLGVGPTRGASARLQAARLSQRVKTGKR